MNESLPIPILLRISDHSKQRVLGFKKAIRDQFPIGIYSVIISRQNGRITLEMDKIK